jgi:hypothetical protein
MPSDVSYGIPDNWGAAAVVYALIEGLAGIKDAGVAYDRAVIAPRWPAAGVTKAAATAKYEASGGYLTYRYGCDRRKKRLWTEFTGSGTGFDLEIMMPKGARCRAATLDGEEVPVEIRTVEESVYTCLKVRGLGAHRAEVVLG